MHFSYFCFALTWLSIQLQLRASIHMPFRLGGLKLSDLMCFLKNRIPMHTEKEIPHHHNKPAENVLNSLICNLMDIGFAVSSFCNSGSQ